jgi:hypothetical protein
VLTVDSTNPASGVAITVSPADSNGAANGTTSFARTYDAGTSVTLKAPATSGSDAFTAWSGCGSASGATCTVTMNASATVTANYAVVKVTPTVTVTPLAASITAVQALTVTVALSVPSGDAAPTGSVTLSSGSYTSAAATLASGSATISVAAGSLAVGSDTLTVSYTPDSSSSSIYTSATGTAPETVAKATPTVTVTPSAASITTVQALTVTVAVSGGNGNPAPTGSVTLSGGGYTSAAATLAGGGATINIAAGALAVGSDTLTVSYTPDAASSAIYNGASGTSPETVNQAYTLTVNSTNPASGVTITVTYPPTALSSQGTTSFTVGGTAGETLALSAPATANGNNFTSWTGCTTTSTVNCNVTLNGNMTVTANYAAAKTTPTVTVTPSAASITSAQALTVTVGVSGGGGNPTPTGSVTLTSGSYTSAAATLASGSATISVAAGALAAGSDTLTVSYTPDSNSSSVYNSATGTAPVTVTAATTFTLTIDSTAPASGVDIQAIPADINNDGYGPTPLTLTYNPGTAVALSAPSSSGGYAFVSWTGCATTSGEKCNVTVNANTTVTANYNKPSITSITVTPSAATIGTQVQFKATVTGTGAFNAGVTWKLSCPLCGSLNDGTLSPSGLYTTPYPAPASVTVTATSTQAGYTNVSGSATVALSAPATAPGPALTVDVGTKTHAISPYIYGMNYYAGSQPAAAASISLPIDRWGGNEATSYNYLNDVVGKGSDWYFENYLGSKNPPTGSSFNSTVASDAAVGAKTMGTVPIIGWVPANNNACSYSVKKYGAQQAVDPYRADCGNGTLTNGTRIKNDPTDTYYQVTPATFDGAWVSYLVSKFGTAANGGVAIYELDNEPSWWDGVHEDVHPVAFTYDEVTNTSIATAQAIKTADPTAGVSGPVMDYWWDYFYSKKDVENGWGTGPCYSPFSGPVDRKAHGGVPFIEYYLQQFAAASNTYGARLLDYVDLHTYFAAEYPAGSGNGVTFAAAGDTGAQQARLNSTRVFWDPTYTDSSNNFTQPNYPTDANYTSSCNPPQQAPQVITMAQGWAAKDYPGTKVAFTEYSWGGLESINGALAQADILGIFGSYGLDLATLWGTPDPNTQVPGLMAYKIYRNYDGNKSKFGDTSLASVSVNQGQLSVYGAVRASDNAVTVVVINKTYGELTSTLSLEGLPSTVTSAQAFLYSNANLKAIVAQTAATVKPPASAGKPSTIANYTFPAQSITLFVVPQ